MNKKIKDFFYYANHDFCYTKWWQGVAYEEHQRNKRIMVIYPFNYPVMFAWWVNMKWNDHRHKPSWINRHDK